MREAAALAQLVKETRCNILIEGRDCSQLSGGTLRRSDLKCGVRGPQNPTHDLTVLFF